MHGSVSTAAENLMCNFFNFFLNINFLIVINMKRIFINFLVVAALSVSAALTSCDKDNKDKDGDEGGGASGLSGNKLSVSVVNGSKYSSAITQVKVVVYDPTATFGPDHVELASALYGKGSFTLNLPETLNAKYLEAFNFGDGANVSNPNAKITNQVGIRPYNGNNALDDEDLEYVKIIDKNKGKYVLGYLIYTDSNVTVSGTGTHTYNDYDDYGEPTGETWTETWNYSSFNLKTGWNMVFYTRDESAGFTATASTTDPGGLKWYLDDDVEALFD
jgi:hypothetical protein